MVALSEQAVAAVRRTIDESVEPVLGLRIMAEHQGCAGLRYFMGLECDPMDDDTVYCCDGISVFVDIESLPILQGIKVDFVDGPDGPGFTFDNPNDSGLCACGLTTCH